MNYDEIVRLEIVSTIKHIFVINQDFQATDEKHTWSIG